MITKFYGVMDNAVKCFLPPFTARNDAEAKRMLETTVNKPGHQFATHPMDYALYQLGEFNDSNGKLLPNPEPVRVCGAIDCIWEEQQSVLGLGDPDQTAMFTTTGKAKKDG